MVALNELTSHPRGYFILTADGELQVLKPQWCCPFGGGPEIIDPSCHHVSC